MHRRWSRIFALSMGIPLILAFLAACGAGTGNTPSSTTTNTQGGITVKIGSDFPTTQKDESAGKPAENGIRYAVDKANKENFLPGYNFVLVAKDDVGAGGTHDQTVGQKNVNELIGDAQVSAIIGPLNSSIAQAEMPITNRAGIALISPANTNDCLTRETPAFECGGTNSRISSLRPTGKVTYFRTATPDEYQGKALAQYAYKEKHYTKAYVIDDTETYGAGLATNFVTAFKGYGGTVVGQQSIKSTNSYEAPLTTVANAKPDFIFFGGNDSTGGTTIRQQMATVPGLQNLPFFAGDGNKTSGFAKAIAPLNGGPVYNTIPGANPDTVPASKDFYSNVQKYGSVGAYSAGAYDDTEIVLNAIKTVITTDKVLPPNNSNDSAAAKTFRQKVIDAIQKASYSGLTGSHSFDTNGDTTNRSISLYTVGDPKVADGWKYVEAIDATK